MANHASTRTTQLYDRRRDEVSLDEAERILIWMPDPRQTDLPRTVADLKAEGTTMNMNTKPFRFGVSVRHAHSRAEWVEKARKIEALGFATLTVPDHLTDLMAPMPALVSAAEATKTLRLGNNVLNNDLRHPVLVAREAATVDLLTDGRLQLGLGAGSIRI